MIEKTSANPVKPGKPLLGWLAAITAAAGLLAAFVIAIMRFGKPPRSRVSKPDYHPATFPTPIKDGQSYSPRSGSGSQELVTLDSPGLAVRAGDRVDAVTSPNTDTIKADTTRWSITTKYVVGVGISFPLCSWLF